MRTAPRPSVVVGVVAIEAMPASTLDEPTLAADGGGALPSRAQEATNMASAQNARRRIMVSTPVSRPRRTRAIVRSKHAGINAAGESSINTATE
jgi:hypothetical protein